MTEEFAISKTSVFDTTSSPELHFGAENTTFGHNRAGYKRHLTHRWCARLAASGMPGTDLAVEYIYGKYIKNLSVSTIKQSGCIILYFLSFLERQGTTIYTLTRQDVSAYVQYEKDRDLTTQSVVNHLRAIYAFINFLIDQGVLPYTIMQPKIKIKLPQALPRAIPACLNYQLMSAA